MCVADISISWRQCTLIWNSVACVITSLYFCQIAPVRSIFGWTVPFLRQRMWVPWTSGKGSLSLHAVASPQMAGGQAEQERRATNPWGWVSLGVPQTFSPVHILWEAEVRRRCKPTGTAPSQPTLHRSFLLYLNAAPELLWKPMKGSPRGHTGPRAWPRAGRGLGQSWS